MSKKTPIKKTKRRLKRTVRRSLAAVLMITAIGVAAIPVPENYAGNSGEPSGSGSSATKDYHDMSGYGYNPIPYSVDNDNHTDVVLDTGLNLSKYSGCSIDDFLADKDANNSPKTPLYGSEVWPSLTVTDLGGGTLDLCWQFLYYEVKEPHSGAKRGAICKYNDQYFADKVDLSLNPNTEYYTVTEEKYNGFFSGTDKSSMNADPLEAVIYSYNDYINNMLPDKDKEFFLKYFKDAYEAKEKEFATYKDAKDKYNSDKDRYPDPGNIPPATLSKIPSNDLTSEQKLEYYCEHDTNLIACGTGYSLRSVSNSLPGKSGTIYLAQGGTPTEGYYNDDYGFLVTNRSEYLMCAIGDGAFKGVTKVVNMEIPSMIGYIGDEAFADATLMESIKIYNVESIGNRAFKGCTKLNNVEISQATRCIGAECFSNTAIQSITLPVSIDTIGYGAFANCKQLTSVDLNGIRTDCKVKDYAFYNCAALKEIKMQDSAIKSIGKGAFAVEAGSQPLEVVLPKEMSATNSIGDYMFVGRAGLKSVVFPVNIGRNATSIITLPKNMFHGCVNLEYVEFPADPQNDPQACGYVEFPKVDVEIDGENVEKTALFLDVINPNFLVKGPKNNSGGEEAYPRTGTWDAVTAVSDTVSYLYIENGKEYYEISDGKFLLCANSEGVLTSGDFKPGLPESEKKNVTLPIKPTVGKTKITSIASDCFKKDEFNQAVVKLEIYDDSISSISDKTFYGWENLEEVEIGNSVASIGASAFEGCTNLIDVSFNTPIAGYDSFPIDNIGKDAFKTGSDKLTFHGDIVEKYAPFEWAMDKNNFINEQDGIRVCYKSDAGKNPTYLSVMYDANTDMVTLLDYPKIEDITKYFDDEYNASMEAKYYEAYGGSEYDEFRKRFANEWNDTADSDVETLYDSLNYGPWINEDFCSNWQTYLASVDTEEKSMLAKAYDIFFEPLVVEAATSSPIAFYDKYPYKVLENEKYNDLYHSQTEEERAFLYAVKNIVVPAGVESIDVNGFKNSSQYNANNVRTYFSRTYLGNEVYDMYYAQNDDLSDSIAGLFSGYYVDKKTPDSSITEANPRGNDYIQSVTLNNVKYLPDYAFDSCENLQYVVLGKDCKDIGTAPFRGCTSLTTVGNNDYYKTDNGIVYSVNTDGSYTIEECLPARGNLVGGAQLSLSTDANLGNVSVIKDGAFEECKYINLIDLSDTAGLKDIPKNCFRNCEDLTRLSLPRSVNNIEEGAFVDDLKLVELTIPGTEVFISASAFKKDSVDKPKAWTTILTYADSSARRYADTYKDTYKLTYEQKKDEWRVIFLDSDLNQVGDAQYVEDNAYVSNVPNCPPKDNWTFEKWLGTNNVEVTDRITSDTTFVAQGYSNNGMVNGKYTVAFYDQVDGTQIGTTQYVEPGQAAIAPQAPVHTGYTFLKWSSEEYTNVQKNLTIMAMYSGGSATTSGGSTTTSGGTTTTSGGTTSTSSSSSNTSSSTSSSSSNTSSSSNSSNTSGSGSTTGTYAVTVVNGSGSGSYAVGSTVTITANTPAEGMVFQKWTTESNGVTLASVSLSTTTFVMPANAVTVTANYVAGNGATAATTGTGNGGSTTGNNGNTVVDITKPGISNKDLATANVNGSTDNFVIKISETDEATRAVAAALTNKYGSLDNILYYAMDITLYDSTGTTKITDTSGLSIDITIPIPDALVAYGGNNMAGAVINGDQLEELNESFTTINGVPCVRFTATHFSPYTIYVDTGNLTEGMLDVTPKTGDPIHPKWFLSIGLACLSIILFLKKDKKVKVKTA